MTILHAWINLRAFHPISRSEIDKIENHVGISIYRVSMNGEAVINFFMCHNHYGTSFDFFFEAMEKVIEFESPDTYGLIYLFNDEDPLFYDKWQVWTISKNKLEKREDSFLSPYSEKVAWFPKE